MPRTVTPANSLFLVTAYIDPAQVKSQTMRKMLCPPDVQIEDQCWEAVDLGDRTLMAEFGTFHFEGDGVMSTDNIAGIGVKRSWSLKVTMRLLCQSLIEHRLLLHSSHSATVSTSVDHALRNYELRCTARFTCR